MLVCSHDFHFVKLCRLFAIILLKATLHEITPTVKDMCDHLKSKRFFTLDSYEHLHLQILKLETTIFIVSHLHYPKLIQQPEMSEAGGAHITYI